MVGPETAAPNSLVIIKFSSLENDPKFDCNPRNDDWKIVKFLETNEIGIIFVPKQQGTYVFSYAANKDNKTTLLTHQIKITDSIPAPNGDFEKQLIDALKKDNPSREQVQQLFDTYKLAEIDKAKDINELLTSMRKNAPPPNTLTNTRKILDQYLSKKLPKQNITMTKIIREAFAKEFGYVCSILGKILDQK